MTTKTPRAPRQPLADIDVTSPAVQAALARILPDTTASREDAATFNSAL